MRPVVRYLVVTLGLLATAPAWAAATLSGVVSLNRERGTPVSGVQVFARGANSVMTGNDGQFVLTFPDGRPGQDVRVQVARPGWEVVNDILLDHRLPEASSSRTFEVIVCIATEREQRVAEFYRLKGSDAVEQTFKAKVADLEARRAASAQELTRLQRERDQALKQVEEWARKAATRRPEGDGSYPAALRLFLAGDSDAALEVLSDARLRQEAARAKDDLNRALEGWLLKAQLLTSRFDSQGAARAYEEAITFGATSPRVWLAYGSFHQAHQRYASARRGYQEALRLARLASEDSNAALALNGLAMLSLAENRYDEARGQLDEALSQFRSLARTNPSAYQSEVAFTLVVLGILNADENREDVARRQLEEALGLVRPLAEKYPQLMLPQLAMTLTPLGFLELRTGRPTQARSLLQEAMGVLRSLTRPGSAAYQIELTTTMRSLAGVERAEGRYVQARALLEEAVATLRPLAARNPDVYLVNAGLALEDLGTLNKDEGRYAEARTQLEEALDIQRSLAQPNPEPHLFGIATTLNNLGDVARLEGRLEEARRYHEDALAVLRPLAQRQPEAYLPALAVTLGKLGHVRSAEGRQAEARRQYQEALAILRSAAKSAPGLYELQVRELEKNLGALPP